MLVGLLENKPAYRWRGTRGGLVPVAQDSAAVRPLQCLTEGLPDVGSKQTASMSGVEQLFAPVS